MSSRNLFGVAGLRGIAGGSLFLGYIALDRLMLASDVGLLSSALVLASVSAQLVSLNVYTPLNRKIANSAPAKRAFHVSALTSFVGLNTLVMSPLIVLGLVWLDYETAVLLAILALAFLQGTAIILENLAIGLKAPLVSASAALIRAAWGMLLLAWSFLADVTMPLWSVVAVILVCEAIASGLVLRTIARMGLGLRFRPDRRVLKRLYPLCAIFAGQSVCVLMIMGLPRVLIERTGDSEGAGRLYLLLGVVGFLPALIEAGFNATIIVQHLQANTAGARRQVDKLLGLIGQYARFWVLCIPVYAGIFFASPFLAPHLSMFDMSRDVIAAVLVFHFLFLVNRSLMAVQYVYHLERWTLGGLFLANVIFLVLTIAVFADRGLFGFALAMIGAQVGFLAYNLVVARSYVRK